MSSLYASKLKLPVVFQKRHWNFAFAFEHLWLDLELLNPHFPLKLYPATLERQLNDLKCFVTVPVWQSNNLGIILCHQSFLLHCLSLTCWKLLPFLESIWFFSYDFKNIEHLITLVNSNAASREPLIIFIALMVSPSTNWRAWPWQCHMDSISFMHAATPVLAASMLDASSGPNLDLLCVQQSGAAPFCENYAKLYFDAKHLVKGLNRRW